MPAKADIQNYLKILDYRLRGNDVKGCIKTFYDTIKVGMGKTECGSRNGECGNNWQLTAQGPPKGSPMWLPLGGTVTAPSGKGATV